MIKNESDDFNCFKTFPRQTSNDAIFKQLKECQNELHTWGHANQVEFDAGKEHLAVSSTEREGESFNILGVIFDCKMLMPFTHAPLRQAGNCGGCCAQGAFTQSLS